MNCYDGEWRAAASLRTTALHAYMNALHEVVAKQRCARFCKLQEIGDEVSCLANANKTSHASTNAATDRDRTALTASYKLLCGGLNDVHCSVRSSLPRNDIASKRKLPQR
jgi:hypothetical protein